MTLMTKEQLIELVSSRMRLLRSEYNFSQDKMAEIIGVSKKTLVQIEKDRILASWSTVVAVLGIFRESEIIKMTIGEDPLEIVEMISFENVTIPKNTTGGGKMFWRTLETKHQFRVQKHILTGHYRIIDGNDKRWVSALNKDYIQSQLNELIQRGEDDEEKTE